MKYKYLRGEAKKTNEITHHYGGHTKKMWFVEKIFEKDYICLIYKHIGAGFAGGNHVLVFCREYSDMLRFWDSTDISDARIKSRELEGDGWIDAGDTQGDFYKDIRYRLCGFEGYWDGKDDLKDWDGKCECIYKIGNLEYRFCNDKKALIPLQITKFRKDKI